MTCRVNLFSLLIHLCSTYRCFCWKRAPAWSVASCCSSPGPSSSPAFGLRVLYLTFASNVLGYENKVRSGHLFVRALCEQPCWPLQTCSQHLRRVFIWMLSVLVSHPTVLGLFLFCPLSLFDSVSLSTAWWSLANSYSVLLGTGEAVHTETCV